MFFAASLLLLVGLVVGDDNPDEIKSLPGVQFDVNFRHYSGYLQVAPTRFYHYWFVESQNNPTSDPVIFWFNGGPGCSSIDGLLNEMGPYIINRDGKTLRANEYAWNKFASVVYIESPAGVGFSYATDGNLTTADWQTAEDNYEALKQFFAKYPSFRENKVFTAGESYGGVYVPTLTSLIVEGQSDFPINLRGMLIGNGYVNTDENLNTVLRFAYAHGIVGEKAWRTLENECCRGCDDTCDFANVKTPHCQHLVEDIYNFLWAGGLNPYDLYRNCDPSPTVNSVRHTVNFAGIGAGASKRGMHYGNATDFMSYIQQQQSRKILSSDQDLADVPCLNDTDLTVYLNDPEVRKAIHVDNDYVKRWYICSGTIDYHKVVTDTAPQFKEIVAARVRVLLYYGDTDMACNFLLGQEFSANLGLPQTLPKTPWKVDGQIAGFKTLYKGLTYTTIRGAGHMAPQWRAPQTTHVIQAFINNHPI